jgi:hypothetical protein
MVAIPTNIMLHLFTDNWLTSAFYFNLETEGCILRCFERRPGTPYRGIFLEKYNIFACTVVSQTIQAEPEQELVGGTNFTQRFFSTKLQENKFSILLRDEKISVLHLKAKNQDDYIAWGEAFALGRKWVPPARQISPRASLQPLDNLLFVIHGIGTSEANFQNGVNAFKERMDGIHQLVYQDVVNNYKIIPCRWREGLLRLSFIFWSANFAS